jgi:putative transposase
MTREHGSRTPKALQKRKGAAMDAQSNRWHHSPLHLFVPNTIYMVTASTLNKQHVFLGDERLELLQDALLEVTMAYMWSLQAWAVFSNHYHFIAKSPDDATTLKKMIQRLHSQTSRAVNRLDGVSGRQVWFQYWDTCLTFEKSYYARLNYVHNNAVKHSLVEEAVWYPFCSAAWFKANADQALRHNVEAASYDQIDIQDDFVPLR